MRKTNKSATAGERRQTLTGKCVTIWLLMVCFLFTSSIQAATYYYHTDHLGTPQALTDENQDVVWAGEYSPFGEVSETVASVEQNLRFPGQYYDVETGLHYNYFRTYDPQTGRYVESDPIGLGGGISTYGYAYQNPSRYSDPTGELVPVAFAIWAAFEFALSAYDAYNTASVFANECSSVGDMLGAGGLFFAGMVLPGGGYSKLSDATKKTTHSGIGVTRHSVQQKINRQVRSTDELDAIKNPLEVGPVKVDQLGRPSQRSIGRKAEVARNPETGNIVSVNPTSTKKAERFLRRRGGQ